MINVHPRFFRVDSDLERHLQFSHTGPGIVDTRLVKRRMLLNNSCLGQLRDCAIGQHRVHQQAAEINGFTHKIAESVGQLRNFQSADAALGLPDGIIRAVSAHFVPVPGQLTHRIHNIQPVGQIKTASAKNVVADGFRRAAQEGDLPQSPAAIEGTLSDEIHRGGNGQLIEPVASADGVVTDCGKGGRQGDVHQEAQAAEGIVADACHTFLYLHILDRTNPVLPGPAVHQASHGTLPGDGQCARGIQCPAQVVLLSEGAAGAYAVGRVFKLLRVIAAVTAPFHNTGVRTIRFHDHVAGIPVMAQGRDDLTFFNHIPAAPAESSRCCAVLRTGGRAAVLVIIVVLRKDIVSNPDQFIAVAFRGIVGNQPDFRGVAGNLDIPGGYFSSELRDQVIPAVIDAELVKPLFHVGLRIEPEIQIQRALLVDNMRAIGVGIIFMGAFVVDLGGPGHEPVGNCCAPNIEIDLHTLVVQAQFAFAQPDLLSHNRHIFRTNRVGVAIQGRHFKQQTRQIRFLCGIVTQGIIYVILPFRRVRNCSQYVDISFKGNPGQIAAEILTRIFSPVPLLVQIMHIGSDLGKHFGICTAHIGTIVGEINILHTGAAGEGPDINHPDVRREGQTFQAYAVHERLGIDVLHPVIGRTDGLQTAAGFESGMTNHPQIAVVVQVGHILQPMEQIVAQLINLMDLNAADIRGSLCPGCFVCFAVIVSIGCIDLAGKQLTDQGQGAVMGQGVGDVVTAHTFHTNIRSIRFIRNRGNFGFFRLRGSFGFFRLRGSFGFFRLRGGFGFFRLRGSFGFFRLRGNPGILRYFGTVVMAMVVGLLLRFFRGVGSGGSGHHRYQHRQRQNRGKKSPGKLHPSFLLARRKIP